MWALDTTGRLHVRRDVQVNVFPEGTYWQTLPVMPNDPIHIGIFHSIYVLNRLLVSLIFINYIELNNK